MPRKPVLEQTQQTYLTPIVPMTAIEAAMAFWLDGLRFWQRMSEVYLDNLRRNAAWMRSHNVIAQGADWMDHYGRRAHDVDVERV